MDAVVESRSQGPKYSRPNIRTPYAEPRDGIERQLVLIWQELLGIEPIGINDNFFDLGGHSLLATKLASRLREAFQIEMSIRTLFISPTIAELAVQVVQAQAEGVDDETLARLLAEVNDQPADQVAG
jgi:acyl carrier protein